MFEFVRNRSSLRFDGVLLNGEIRSKYVDKAFNKGFTAFTLKFLPFDFRANTVRHS